MVIVSNTQIRIANLEIVPISKINLTWLEGVICFTITIKAIITI